MPSKPATAATARSKGPIAPPPTALFPPHDERLRIDDILSRTLLDANARVARGPVNPDFDRERFQRELLAYDFAAPLSLTKVCDWTIQQLEHGIVHITHPRYFGLYNPLPSFPSQCADRIASALNPQLASATTSPAAVDIEKHVIRAIGRRAGFGDTAAGSFTSGGSEANQTALVLALTQASPAFATDGARAFPGMPVFYVSRDCHLAWLKISQMCGLGRNAVRMIATDGMGRMDANALARTVDQDTATGCLPVMVVATAGTTAAGMVDPIAECEMIARRHSMWFHVDAAWAGALLASDEHRNALAGIELADSITIDAHKWFAATMGCGMIITRAPEILTAAFHAAADYMPSQTASVDPYLTSIQWSRRFLGLRLFLSLATAGWQGFATHVERAIALATNLHAMMTERGWRVVNQSPAAVLNLVPPPGSVAVRDIVQRIVNSGEAWVSVARFEGADVIRVCISHGLTGGADINSLRDLLVREAATVAVA